jgi:uncharacterized lipoprotein NlpE involved in copper resistance
MTLNLTQKLVFPLLLTLLGCKNQQDDERYQQLLRQRVDKAAEARIDSAYAAILTRCDSLLVNQVPLWADSIVRAMDSINHLQTVTHGK